MKEGEIDPKFWELLMSAEKKDYESICSEFGVTDFRWMLKKLNEMKIEREEEQAKVGLLTTCGQPNSVIMKNNNSTFICLSLSETCLT